MRYFVYCFILIAFCFGLTRAADTTATPIPKRIRFQDTTSYQRLLGGPPETRIVRSGCVTLKPGKSVGKHNTESYEEVVVVLDGSGEMRITGGRTLSMDRNTVLYCPMNIEHDIVNTGKRLLRYVYIVAKVKE